MRCGEGYDCNLFARAAIIIRGAAMHTVTPKQLSKLLLSVALTRPVFIWGPPGIGKSALVEQFACEVWLDWAYREGIHPWILRYLEARPDHLFVAPPKTEETFTSPRSWHILSDALHSYGADVAPEEVEMLAAGCLSVNHGRSFAAFIKQ